MSGCQGEGCCFRSNPGILAKHARTNNQASTPPGQPSIQTTITTSRHHDNHLVALFNGSQASSLMRSIQQPDSCLHRLCLSAYTSFRVRRSPVPQMSGSVMPNHEQWAFDYLTIVYLSAQKVSASVLDASMRNSCLLLINGKRAIRQKRNCDTFDRS